MFRERKQVVQVVLENIVDDAQVHLCIAVHQHVPESGHGVQNITEVLRHQPFSPQEIEQGTIGFRLAETMCDATSSAACMASCRVC